MVRKQGVQALGRNPDAFCVLIERDAGVSLVLAHEPEAGSRLFQSPGKRVDAPLVMKGDADGFFPARVVGQAQGNLPSTHLEVIQIAEHLDVSQIGRVKARMTEGKHVLGHDRVDRAGGWDCGTLNLGIGSQRGQTVETAAEAGGLRVCHKCVLIRGRAWRGGG